MTELSKRFRRNQTLICIRIPKTGGGTLREIVWRQYEKNACYRFASGWDDDDLGPVDELKNLPDTQKEGITAIEGHIPFGVHEYLPQPSAYITTLRDPVDLVISLYYYIRRVPHVLNHYYQVKNMSLQDFVCSGMPSTENMQTRYLRGTDALFGQPLSFEDLETVKKNLQDRFAIVGLLERFDETLILFRRAFGWRNVFYVKKNVTRNRPSKKAIPRNIVAAIEKRNELDMELYRYAEDMFDGVIHEQDSSFDRELYVFQLQNKLYQTQDKLYQRIQLFAPQQVKGRLAQIVWLRKLYRTIRRRSPAEIERA